MLAERRAGTRQLRIGVARLEIHPLASGAEARAEPPR